MVVVGCSILCKFWKLINDILYALNDNGLGKINLSKAKHASMVVFIRKRIQNHFAESG